MKKSLPQKYRQRLNIQASKIEGNLKTNFRHRDRGVHSGRVRGK
jgi:hypothetical protein